MNNQNTHVRRFFQINRKLHIHLGLFILLFLWMYFLSGLIIHHGKWKFAQFWEKRIESKTDFTLSKDQITTNPQIVDLIKEKFKLKGEVENLQLKPEKIDFRINTPGLLHEVHIDPITGNGTMKVLQYNFWGKLRTLHVFNGINKNEPSKTPNWIVSKFWRLMMDVTAIVMIILCLGSWIMWYKVRKDYKLGAAFLGAGLVIGAYFIFWI
jgi:hypothetical protein